MIRNDLEETFGTNYFWSDLMVFGKSQLPEGDVGDGLPLTTSVRESFVRRALGMLIYVPWT